MTGTPTKSPSKKDEKNRSRAGRPEVEAGTVVRRRRGRRAATMTAATADKYELYQLSVQSPEADVEFLRKEFKALRKRKARHLREDFCGTALLSSEWLRDSKKNTAEGFDLDPECLEWGRRHNLGPLGREAARCVLHEADVREPGNRRPDLRVAFNFSYQVFKSRAELLEYFRGIHADLVEDGIFGLDLHGGPESSEELEEEKELDEGFTYVWEQGEYHPVTGAQHCAIHFEFDDGTELRNAFTYEWRLWTMPELVDLLKEAGFAEVRCYFEGDDPDSDEGNGEFEYSPTGENCPSWIAYVLALK